MDHALSIGFTARLIVLLFALVFLVFLVFIILGLIGIITGTIAVIVAVVVAVLPASLRACASVNTALRISAAPARTGSGAAAAPRSAIAARGSSALA